MSSRHTARRPNRRQLDASRVNTNPLTIQLDNLSVGGGNTLAEIILLGKNSGSQGSAPGFTPNEILLTGMIDGTYTTVLCDTVGDGIAEAAGVRVILTFSGEVDIFAPYEIAIPATMNVFGQPTGSRPWGSLAPSEAGSLVDGGYVRITNLPDGLGPTTPLMFVDRVTDLGGNLLRLRIQGAGGGFAITGPIQLENASLTTTTNATPTAFSANEFDFQFASAIGAGSEFENLIAWQPGIRGTNGAWLSPFGIRVV